MSGIATAIAGTAVVSGYVASKNADKAAEAQQDASQQASNTELQMFNKNAALTAPWRKAGEKALGTLEEKVYAGPGEFTKSPGYDFRFSEGTKAVDRSAAARGGLNSGRTMKALTKFGQDYATNEYDNFLNRYYQSLTPLQSLSGVGQTTATNTAQMGANVASNVAQNQEDAGTARATGYINQGNAWTSAAQTGLDAYGSWKGWGAK
jgi:hypothetical protein